MQSSATAVRATVPGLDARGAAAFVVLLALAMLWIDPYRFPVRNHAQEVPPILATLEPQLYQHDFAVQSFLGPTPRIFYQRAIAGFAGLGVPISVVYFAFQMATLLACAWVFWRLCEWIAAESPAQLAVLAASVLTLWAVGANHYLWNLPIIDGRSAVPATFAMGFVLWGWFAGLRRHWGRAYLLFGLGALVQFLVGFMPGLLLAPAMLRDHSRDWRRAAGPLVLGVGAWATCLGIIALPMLAARHAPDISTADLVRIYGHVRVPHHWIPSTAGALHWINQGLLMVAGLVLARALPDDSTSHRIRLFSVVTVTGTAVLMLMNYLFVEHWPVAIIAKLQFQRAMPFGHFAILVACAAAFIDTLRRGSVIAALSLVIAPLGRADGAALLLWACAYASLSGQASTRIAKGLMLTSAVISLAGIPWPARMPVPPAALLLAGVITAAAAVRLSQRVAASYMRTLAVLAAAAAMSVTALTLLLGGALGGHPVARLLARQSPRLNAVSEIPADVQAASQLVHARVPVQDIILGPIWALEELPLLSQRGVVFSWKNVPYTDAGIREWGRRLSDILGFVPTRHLKEAELNEAWARRTPEQLRQVARRYGARFIISRPEWHTWSGARLLGSAGPWQLWRLEN